MDSSNNFCDGISANDDFISSKKGLWKILDALNRFSTKRTYLYGAQYKLFATFALINYFIPYFMWMADLDGGHMTLLQFRSISSFLCFLLALKDIWPKVYARYLPLYWHCTLMYCLPYTTTFLLLKSEGDVYWLLNMILVMFLLAILTDWLSFILILFIGSGLSCLSYMLFQGEIHLQIDDFTLSWCIYMYTFCILIGFIFARNKSKIDEVRLGSFNVLGATIAHEMRTPLLSLEMYTEAIARYIESLKASLEGALSQEELRASTLNTAQFLENTVLNMRLMNRNTFHTIDMLLTKIKASRLKDFPLQRCSMKDCVEKAFEHYPLSKAQKSKVDLSGVEDFFFKGNEALMEHVLFNLIKNALYFTKKSGKGSITVWTQRQDEFWTALHFRDTGTGIPQECLPSVFKKFFTRSKYGTGIGLYFCKKVIEFFGGSILCQSVEGEFTEFIISLHLDEKVKK
jgi:signal transduction histidine kinase